MSALDHRQPLLVDPVIPGDRVLTPDGPGVYRGVFLESGRRSFWSGAHRRAALVVEVEGKFGRRVYWPDKVTLIGPSRLEGLR